MEDGEEFLRHGTLLAIIADVAAVTNVENRAAIGVG